jgi:hypothetical protein
MKENFEDNFSIPQEYCSSINQQILEFILTTYKCDKCKNIPRFPLRKEIKSSTYYCNNCIGDSKDIIYPQKAELGLFEHIDVSCFNAGCTNKFPYKNLKEFYDHSMRCPHMKNNSVPVIFSTNIIQKMDGVIRTNNELTQIVGELNKKNKFLEEKILQIEKEFQDKLETNLKSLKKEITLLKSKHLDLQQKFQNKAAEIKKKIKVKIDNVNNRMNDLIMKTVQNSRPLSPNLNNYMTHIHNHSKNNIETKFFESTPPQNKSYNKHEKEIVIKDFLDERNLSSVDIDTGNSFLPLVMDHEIFKSLNIKKAVLLYRGSENDFSAQAFHMKCDNRGPTVTIIRSEKGNIFGGYTPIPWDSSNTWGRDENKDSFLFSITRSSKHKLVKPKYAIDNCAVFGPTFGNGADLYISDECHMNESSYTELGDSYESNYKFQSLDARSYLSGSIKYFRVEEYEVYLIY